MTVTTDTDLAEFTDDLRRPGPKGCLVGHALHDRLDPNEADKLRKALAAVGRVQHAQIERWLRDRGVSPYSGSVARHRNGECRCQEHGYV